MKTKTGILLFFISISLSSFSQYDMSKTPEVFNFNVFVFILTTLFLLGITWLYFQRRKYLMLLRIQNHKLQITKSELHIARNHIEEKTQIIKELQATHQEIVTEVSTSLKNCVILTEEDWDEFQLLFEKSYPGFINKLVQSYPNLSSADLRYILLAYLNFSHKEMASSLGISADSLRVTWYRLRKKIHLSSTTTVHEFIKHLNNPKQEVKKTVQIKMVTGL